MFGSNANPSLNGDDSTVKNYLENTWFAGTNGVSAYEDILENSAGYCNDRTVYNQTSPYDQWPSSYTITSPDTTAFNFGAEHRLVAAGDYHPTLNCQRSVVDLYTTEDATNGNKQLTKPVALITADEAAFAGNSTRVNNGGFVAESHSFLGTHGMYWWTMSPSVRDTIKTMYMMSVYGNGQTAANNIDAPTTNGRIRPVISLISGVAPSSGSGTAADPWVIDAPTP